MKETCVGDSNGVSSLKYERWDDTGRPEDSIDLGAFRQFELLLSEVNEDLVFFSNALRGVGSSGRLLAISETVRSLLSEVRNGFHSIIGSSSCNTDVRFDQPVLFHKSRGQDTNTSGKAPGLEDSLAHLAREVVRLSNSAAGILNFDATSTGQHLEDFAAHLNEMSVLITQSQANRSQGARVEVVVYICDMGPTFSESFIKLKRTIRQWTQTGIPSLRSRQDAHISTSQNLSTTAIFFSGVTATTIQYSFQLPQASLVLAINTLWMLSLVLSTTSAISSQFAIFWASSPHRSPSFQMPRPMYTVINWGPVTLLASSATAFILGLIGFAFEIFGSHPAVPVIVTIFASSLQHYS